jgi:hypothetical protein
MVEKRWVVDATPADVERPQMHLHLIKLCVGAESIADLDEWIRDTFGRGRGTEQFHVTRMVPARRAELLDGGSLYWVIRGNVQVRQRLLDIRPFVDKDGIGRCKLMLEPKLVPTEWQPRRAFQGWRYLLPADAPVDLAAQRSGDLPPKLRAELAALGLM